jgi:hypothetical protein
MKLYVLIVLFALIPVSSWGFQSHGAPEGLVVHQLAHLFFVVGLSTLVYWLQKNKLVRERGWRFIQIACILLILWNMDTIFGHWVEERVPSDALIGEPDLFQRLSLDVSPWSIYYYFLKMDHLISVPGIIFLFLGIRKLYRRALAGGSD